MSPAVREKYDGAVGAPLSVRMWLRMLSCTMITEKRLRRRFEEQFNTTLPRFDVLAALDRQPQGLTMGELSRACLVSNGNVTALVRQLAALDLVTAEPSPEDGRSSIVTLTPAGKDQFKVLAAAHHAWVAEMFAEVPENVLADLFQALAVVKASLASSRGRAE